MLMMLFKALKQSHSLYNEKPGLYGRVFCWDKCHFDQREKSYTLFINTLHGDIAC